jgi:hypothetical protein
MRRRPQTTRFGCPNGRRRVDLPALQRITGRDRDGNPPWGEALTPVSVEVQGRQCNSTLPWVCAERPGPADAPIADPSAAHRRLRQSRRRPRPSIWRARPRFAAASESKLGGDAAQPRGTAVCSVKSRRWRVGRRRDALRRCARPERGAPHGRHRRGAQGRHSPSHLIRTQPPQQLWIPVLNATDEIQHEICLTR